MYPNHSPWLHQLARTRPIVPLDRDLEADVVIVGGGIAGVVTAFFTLRDTDKTVVLLEAGKIAHGATGHNAGQITSYFERPFSSLVDEFGLDLATDGQRSVESAWTLLEEIVATAGLHTPFYRFEGFAGVATLDQVLQHLKNNQCRLAGDLPTESIIIAREWEHLLDVPVEYGDLYTVSEHLNILTLLETQSTDYIASISYQKGCMNSAVFTEELLTSLVATHGDRFSFYEGSGVKTVNLKKTGVVLELSAHTVHADKVVLCTNGFENFTIYNTAGADIDTAFHHTVMGRIGYMTGYTDTNLNPPNAISYFTQNYIDDPTGDNYFYLTRRPFIHNGTDTLNLVCAGGPEKVLPNDATYSASQSCPEDMKAAIDDFLQQNYAKYAPDNHAHEFCWHGLMGYTPTSVRRIGPEPINPVLLYNLGCNGVGILPSIYGGMKIARFLRGDIMPPSIFDPYNQENNTDPDIL